MSEVQDALSQLDPDRFVASLFMPAELRGHIQTLFALDFELSRIKYVTREVMAAGIRLAWWRDQIAEIYAGQTPKVPLLVDLAGVIEVHALPHRTFEAMIAARAAELSEMPIADLEAMKASIDVLAGPLYELCAKVLRVTQDQHTHSCLMRGARIEAMGRLIAEFAHARRHKIFRLPVTQLHRAGLSNDDVFHEGFGIDRLRPIFDEIRHEARNEIILCPRGDSRSAASLLALAACARYYLDPRFDPITSPPQPSWLRVARVAWTNFLGRV